MLVRRYLNVLVYQFYTLSGCLSHAVCGGILLAHWSQEAYDEKKVMGLTEASIAIVNSVILAIDGLLQFVLPSF